MLDLKQIESFYPEPLRSFKRNVLREYLQYKILEAIFSSAFGAHLAFMGGTAIHVIHANTRFSEDLDFDNRGLKKEDFEQLAHVIQRRLELEGYVLETKNTFGGAYRSSVRIDKILYESGLSRHRDERMLIQVDAEPQEFEYSLEKTILNKFDVFIRINVVPRDILLAQKLSAILMRKRPMGRDFYDAIFLLGKTKPNLRYLKSKLGTRDASALRESLLQKCSEVNFKSLATDVAPFLFVADDARKVLLFPEYVKSWDGSTA